MARPRSVSDDEILAATHRVVAREGALRFTLAQVGEEAGLSAPALVQRFGGKRELLLALAAQSRREPGVALSRARGRHATLVDALVEGVASAMAGMETPKDVARSLDFLALDIADPAFHELSLGFFAAFRGEVEQLLREAKDAGELAADRDVAALARSIEVAFNGSTMTWALHGGKEDASLREAIARDVSAVLAPHRARRRVKPRRRP